MKPDLTHPAESSRRSPYLLTDPGEYWEERARTRREVAATYIDPVMREFEGPLRFRVFFDTVPWWPGIRILDLGSGTGEWAVEFWRRGASVAGIDLSPTMVRMAQERAARHGAEIRFEIGKIEQLPRALDQNFDMITSITVLQHILADTDLVAALARCHQALGAHGRLVCMEHTRGWTRRRGNAYMRFRTRGQWLTFFGNAGFVPERIAVVRRVPVLPYNVYARLRWPAGPPRSLTWDGRIWCGLLRATNDLLRRVLPARAGGDLTLFVLKRTSDAGA